MTYYELLKSSATETGLSASAVKQVIESLSKHIAEEAKAGNVVRLPALGTFSRLDRAARQGRNPQTGQTITIPANSSIKFKAGKAINDALN